MNFREAYRQLNHPIVPDRELTEQMIGKARKHRRRRTYIRWCRPAVALLLVCFGIHLSLPVLAARVDPVYQFLYLLSPKAAQHLMPVRMASEDQGIRMEVVSARACEDTAQIYITMEDLTGDRIDGTTDLYDSYSIHQPFGSIGTCERAGYDEASGKVSFLITLQEQSGRWQDHPLQGDKITFSVSEFLSRKSTYDDFIIPLDLSDLPEDAAVREVDPCGYGGDLKAYSSQNTTEALIPNISVDILPEDGIFLTALGYQDGMLHLQTSLGNTLETDDHGYLWLERDGEKIISLYSIGFRDETDPEHPVSYEEQVFDISREELASCTIHGYYVISGQRTEGNWSVTFPLE